MVLVNMLVHKMADEMFEKVKDRNALYNPEARENQKKIPQFRSFSAIFDMHPKSLAFHSYLDTGFLRIFILVPSASRFTVNRDLIGCGWYLSFGPLALIR